MNSQYEYDGDPNGHVKGKINDICKDLSHAGRFWVKQDNTANDSHGWVDLFVFNNIPKNDPANPATVTGTAQEGEQLLLAYGTWLGGDPETSTPAWQRSTDLITWVTIDGEMSDTYTLATADVGKYVRAVASIGNLWGTNVLNVGPVGPILPA